MQVTVNLVIMGGSSDDMDQLVHAVRSRRRQVKLIHFPTDPAKVESLENPTLLRTLLVETLQNLSTARKHNLLFLLPW